MTKFLDWCREDMTDERKINYEVLRDGKVYHFSSDDEMGIDWLYYVRCCEIQFLKLFNNQWYVTLR